MSDPHDDRGESAPDVREIEADIERTREELAETVDQLAAKLDVKGRARDQVTHTVTTAKESAEHQLHAVRERAVAPDGTPTPTAQAVAGGLLVLAGALIAWRAWAGSRH